MFHTMLRLSARTDLVIDYLNLRDFDRLRATASAVNQFISRFERQLLRRAVERLSVSGQTTHIELQDMLQQQNWTYMINVAGCLDNNLIGRSLKALQERLTTLRHLWSSALTATTDGEIVDAGVQHGT